MLSNTKRLVLGVDGGSSKTMALLADEDGIILGRGSSGPSNFYTAGRQASQEAIRSAVRAAYIQANIPQEPAAVMSLGLGGVDRPEERSQVTNWLTDHGFAQDCIVENDVFLLLWCGRMQGWGVGLIAGTGSIAVGRSRNGKTVRAGGWGYLIGDEGSGYAIGLAALQAGARFADGRGQSTRLLNDILADWNLSQPSDLIPEVYRSAENRSVKIAHLAELVKVGAESGDEVSLAIEAAAARELAAALQSVIRQLGFEGEIPTAFGGSVLVHNSRIANAVRDHLLKDGCQLEPFTLAECPAEGAVNMALQHLKLK